MRFSERVGLVKVKDSIQMDSIDNDLKNGLWNVFYSFHFDKTESVYIENWEQNKLMIDIWHNFFKKPIDKIPSTVQMVIKELRNWFFQCEWYELYDFIEFCTKNEISDNERIIKKYNLILEREVSAFRFISGFISQITTKYEVDEIDKAIINSDEHNLVGVEAHLENSLRMLSDRKNPDYRNSIKESISAVESISKTLSGGKKDSLAAALDKIKGKINLHPSLERGFKQIYGYTSDGDGIRHALMNESISDFDDAKYMLVSCSAFVNYLIAKGIKSGKLM